MVWSCVVYWLHPPPSLHRLAFKLQAGPGKHMFLFTDLLVTSAWQSALLLGTKGIATRSKKLLVALLLALPMLLRLEPLL